MIATPYLTRFTPLADELHELAGRLRESVVTIRAGRQGGGSGVIWSSDGLVITNSHVAQDTDLAVVLPGGEIATAKLVARDRENDLAALAIDRDRLQPALVVDSREARVGQLVVAMGHPFGVAHALTAGIISGLPEPDDSRDLLRADIVLNPGNSGGPLADAQGRVLGINAMVVGPGVALAVPTHVIAGFLAYVDGRVGHLGIEIKAVRLPRSYHERFGLPAPVGLLVTDTLPEGPAHQTGVLLGDVIVKAGGRPVDAPHRLRNEIALTQPGQYISLTVIRGGERREFNLAPSWWEANGAGSDLTSRS